MQLQKIPKSSRPLHSTPSKTVTSFLLLLSPFHRPPEEVRFDAGLDGVRPVLNPVEQCPSEPRVWEQARPPKKRRLAVTGVAIRVTFVRPAFVSARRVAVGKVFPEFLGAFAVGVSGLGEQFPSLSARSSSSPYPPLPHEALRHTLRKAAAPRGPR